MSTPVYPANYVQQNNSGPDPAVTSWDDLENNVPTLGIPVPLLKIWIEAATGLVKTTRLLASTEETDRANGVQRPRDYGEQNHKVWFAAG